MISQRKIEANWRNAASPHRGGTRTRRMAPEVRREIAPYAQTRPCNRLNPHRRAGLDQNSHLCQFLCNWSPLSPDHLGNRTLRAHFPTRSDPSSPLPETAPMISQAKIDANKRNAAKSKGPRTPEGKDKVRFNAVTHGLTAVTVVLPHEDEQAYQYRLEAWTRDLKPPDEPGRYLVERAVRISWQLDRADSAEQARLTKRIQDAYRLFADGGAEPAEILFARLVGTVEAQPAQSLGSRRAGAVPAPVNSPALLLIAWNRRPWAADGCSMSGRGSSNGWGPSGPRGSPARESTPGTTPSSVHCSSWACRSRTPKTHPSARTTP